MDTPPRLLERLEGPDAILDDFVFLYAIVRAQASMTSSKCPISRLPKRSILQSKKLNSVKSNIKMSDNEQDSVISLAKKCVCT